MTGLVGYCAWLTLIHYYGQLTFLAIFLGNGGVYINETWLYSVFKYKVLNLQILEYLEALALTLNSDIQVISRPY